MGFFNDAITTVKVDVLGNCQVSDSMHGDVTRRPMSGLQRLSDSARYLLAGLQKYLGAGCLAFLYAERFAATVAMETPEPTRSGISPTPSWGRLARLRSARGR